MLHDGLPSIYGSVQATLVFPALAGSNKDAACAGFLVGGMAGSFNPGANSFEAWEVALSPAGFLRLAAHKNDFKLLKQVNHVAVAVGKPITLMVQMSPASGATTATSGIRLKISVDGVQLIDFEVNRPTWTAGPVESP